MTDDNILNASIYQHCSRDFSGESTLVLIRNVLSTELYIGSLDCLSNRNNVDCRNAVHNIHIRVVYEGLQQLYELLCFARSLVHLPVSGNNLLTCHNYDSPFPKTAPGILGEDPQWVK